MTDRARTCQRFADMRDVALRAPPLSDEERAAYLSAVAAQAARDAEARAPQPDLLEEAH